MLRHCSTIRCGFSTNMDFSHEKPAPFQLQHVQQRVLETVPLMFKQRLDYTFYRKDVLCDDQIFVIKLSFCSFSNICDLCIFNSLNVYSTDLPHTRDLEPVSREATWCVPRWRIGG
uniref:Uncharacterized protein n=1 Tax=Angiostrongylus cantonensis TaxID=6313 RepID=A0A0K0D5B9_ANGCA